METLYERIDRLCKERGQTVGSMCKATGVASSSMAMLHKGKVKGITLKTAAKIAAFLDITTDELLGVEQKPPEDASLSAARREAMQLLSASSDEKLEKLLPLIKAAMEAIE